MNYTFHQHIEKIDSQGCIVIIGFLTQKGVAWGAGRTQRHYGYPDERQEALQLSWENKTHQSARIPPTSLWSSRLHPLIPREEGAGEGEGKVGGGQLIHVKQ